MLQDPGGEGVVGAGGLGVTGATVVGAGVVGAGVVGGSVAPPPKVFNSSDLSPTSYSKSDLNFYLL